jgi:uncharacterized protein YdeI (YjbR/CyaY-like superfamily)
MPTTDPRVDAYIDKSADFARPILEEIRARVHEACPDAQETIKWSTPHFDYKGPLCAMAAFKAHCLFIFWKSPLVLTGKDGAETTARLRRLTKASDLPPRKEMREYIRKAMALNESGTKLKRVTKAKKPIAVPADFQAALAKNRRARDVFDGLSPSHRREYLEWITEAKSDETRTRRLAQAIEWIAEGKPRNWKYVPAKSTGKPRARA